MTNSAAPPARGLFLDLDGTLSDSMGFLRELYYKFVASHGGQGSEAEFADLAGKTFTDGLAILRRNHGLTESAEEIGAQFMALAGENSSERLRPTPGAVELVTEAARRGVHVAVVTSARQAVAEAFLARFGLSQAVAQVVAAESVGRGKPDPEPYALALARSGLAAELGLAVEDTAVGAASATAAGLSTWIMAPLGPPEGILEMPGVAGSVKRLDELLPLLA